MTQKSVNSSESVGYIRPVRSSDIPVLANIYAYYVANTTISFEYVVPTESEFERRVNAFSSVCPYLVYCEGDKILGYAYAHPAFERAAYKWCAETTIYLSNESRGNGIGGKLYDALTRILELQGYRKLYAIIEASNTQSCAFHMKKGYKLVATFPNTGYKMERWLDVVWYERDLNGFDKSPNEPTLYRKLSPTVIEQICKECSL